MNLNISNIELKILIVNFVIIYKKLFYQIFYACKI